MSFRFFPAVIVFALIAIYAMPANAGSRRFTYIYEADILDEGEVEYEQWGTLKTRKKNDPNFDRLDIRHEVEWGLGDNMQLAVYFDWRYQDGAGTSSDGVTFQDIALEFIYQVADPTKDPLGVALYLEGAYGERKAKIEAKLLLQKNIDKWILAWNGIIEAEWEGSHHSEDKAEIAQVFGISYQIDPSWSVGFELLHEFEIDDWETIGDASVYGGPNVAYRANGWFATITPMFQLTSIDSEPDLQVRLIFGIDF
jgi:hypothetical protein